MAERDKRRPELADMLAAYLAGTLDKPGHIRLALALYRAGFLREDRFLQGTVRLINDLGLADDK